MVWDYAKEKDLVIQAHKNEVQCLEMDYMGKVLVTAGRLGTLFRLYSPQTGEFIHEVRRSYENGTIRGLSFNLSCEL